MSFSSRKVKAADRMVRKAVTAVVGPQKRFRILGISRGHNSTCIRVGLMDDRGSELLVKIDRPNHSKGLLRAGIRSLPSVSVATQQIFSQLVPSWIRLPDIHHWDDGDRILVMDYVDAINLRDILSRRSPSSWFDLHRVSSMCGEALSLWHAASSTLQKHLSLGNGALAKTHVLSYVDFSAWNILVDRQMRFIVLLDFPGYSLSVLPHRDLANYLHSLLVVRHHPATKMHGVRWWNWEDAFACFLHSYMSARGTSPRKSDSMIIQDHLQQKIRHEIENYENRRGLRMMLERLWYARLLNHKALDTDFSAIAARHTHTLSEQGDTR